MLQEATETRAANSTILFQAEGVRSAIQLALAKVLAYFGEDSKITQFDDSKSTEDDKRVIEASITFSGFFPDGLVKAMAAIGENVRVMITYRDQESQRHTTYYATRGCTAAITYEIDPDHSPKDVWAWLEETKQTAPVDQALAPHERAGFVED